MWDNRQLCFRTGFPFCRRLISADVLSTALFRVRIKHHEGELGRLSLGKSVSHASHFFYSFFSRLVVLTCKAYFDPRSESRNERTERVKEEKLQAEKHESKGNVQANQVDTPS